MQIFRRKFGMNFLMNLLHHLGIIGILSVGGWLLLHGQTEVGTVVAFISGLNRMNDPWGDLVNYFREMTNAGVKFRMIAQALDMRSGRAGVVFEAGRRPSTSTERPSDASTQPCRRGPCCGGRYGSPFGHCGIQGASIAVAGPLAVRDFQVAISGTRVPSARCVAEPRRSNPCRTRRRSTRRCP
jgi:ABC-type multidrug transport system fused ATPase/permease subunit